MYFTTFNNSAFLGCHSNTVATAMSFNWFNDLIAFLIFFFSFSPEFVCTGWHLYWPIHFKYNGYLKVKTFLKKLWPVFMDLWMGFICLKATEPLWGDSLLFTIHFPEVPGTHLIELERLSWSWSHPVVLNLRPLD